MGVERQYRRTKLQSFFPFFSDTTIDYILKIKRLIEMC